MAAEGTGATSGLYIKSQTAVDTIPSAGMRGPIPITNFNAKHEVGSKNTSKIIASGTGAVNARYYGPSKKTLTWGTELGFTTLDDLLGGIVGSPTVSGDGAATAYANTYVPTANPLYRYLQVKEGDIPTGKVQGYKNVLINEVTLTFPAEGIPTISVSAVGQLKTSVPASGEDLVTSGAVTVTHVPVVNSMWTIWNTGVGTDTGYCVKSAIIKLSRPLGPDRPCLGSTVYKAPVWGGPLDPSWEFEVEFDDTAALAAFEAQTLLTGVKFKAVGAATGIGSDFYTIEARTTKGLIPQWEIDIPDDGKILQKYVVEGYGNTGSGLAYDAFAIKVTNNYNGAGL